METDEQLIYEVEKQLSRLYYHRFNVDEAIELMRDQNISAELVKNFYNELSTEVEKLTKRFYYTEVERCYSDYVVAYWTRHYLLSYNDITNPSFHEITIFDIFNNKSM
jgi:hypothetical protein